MKTTTDRWIRVALGCIGIFGLSTLAVAQNECPARPTLKIDVHTLDFSEQKPICVQPNGTFRIKLKPQGDYVIDPAKISVGAKQGSIPVQKVSINGNNVMKVKVGNFQSGTEHGYWIRVDDVGILDPRVRINTNYLALTPEMELMDDYTLDNFGISLLQLRDIDHYFQEEFNTSITDVTRSFGELSEGE
jgi:hypothetical protein